MGRKSKADERISQILDAFERCIAMHGLEASSLPRIAEEAGVKHSIIRHYIGNRNALISAMVNRFTAHYKALIITSLEAPDFPDNPSSVIAYFFDEFSRHNAEHVIFSQLFAAAARDKEIRRNLLTLYQEVEALAVRSIGLHHPEIPQAKIESLVYALMSLWMGHTGLFHLGFGPERIHDATHAAELLTETVRRSR